MLVTYRYGKTVLGTSSLPATDEILATAKELGIRKEAVKQGSMAFQQEPEEKKIESTSDASGDTGSSSPETLVHDMAQTFRELPNWKYPALLFIAAAMVFYIVTLSVRIRRSHKRRKKNKKRKKGEF